MESGSSEQSFGAFMLYEWKKGDATQAFAVPGYIYLVLVLGGMASFSNCLSYMGACSRSVCLLSASTSMVLCVLLLEGALALVLFYNPSLVDSKVCPADDTACLERIDNLFKDPSAHAGRACILYFVCVSTRVHACRLCACLQFHDASLALGDTIGSSQIPASSR